MKIEIISPDPAVAKAVADKLNKEAPTNMTIKEYLIKKGLETKTFSDLVFKSHANVNNGIQSLLNLGNGIEISVVSMKKKESAYGGLYGDASQGTYEVAVFRNGDMLPLSAFDDVIGWQTEDEITELMSKLQGNRDNVCDFIDKLYLNKNSLRAELELD